MGINVKYHNGEIDIKNFHNLSAPMVQQILDHIHDDLIPLVGEYKWTLEGTSGKYHILAYWRGDTWFESTGKTPAAALQSFYPAYMILTDKYGFTTKVDLR